MSACPKILLMPNKENFTIKNKIFFQIVVLWHSCVWLVCRHEVVCVQLPCSDIDLGSSHQLASQTHALSIFIFLIFQNNISRFFFFPLCTKWNLSKLAFGLIYHLRAALAAFSLIILTDSETEERRTPSSFLDYDNQTLSLRLFPLSVDACLNHISPKKIPLRCKCKAKWY